jgi:hypothetical protein
MHLLTRFAPRPLGLLSRQLRAVSRLLRDVSRRSRAVSRRSRLAPRRPLAGSRARPALLCLPLSGLLALSATTGAVAAPANVTVRVLGPAPAYEALTPPVEVTTTTAAVTKDGGSGSCPGTSAAGALELATHSDWEGVWSTKYSDYEVISIDGHSYPFEEGSPANYYWSFWQNNVFSQEGVCEAALQAGDQILFVPSCYGPSCPPEPSGLLGIQAPTLAAPGQPVALTVVHYGPKGEPAPLAGVTVQANSATNVPVGASVPASSAATSAPTDSEGRTTISFAAVGPYTLRATAPAGEADPAVPGEALIDVACTASSSAGGCGGPATQEVSKVAPPVVSKAPYTGPYELVAAIAGIRENHIYTPANAPRVLAGTVTSHSSVTSISLRLRRSFHGRCWSYDGARDRLVRVRCGHGSFFKVASGGDTFSYLLPARLPAGRYVLDVAATDSTGKHTALARGSSRVVFYVR